MSLSITSITRVWPAPCQHYNVTVDEDGVSRTVQVDRDDIIRRDAWQEHGPKAALVLLWVRYKLAGGATLASLVGVTIA